MMPIKLSNEDERPCNNKDESHGYWKTYYVNILCYKGHYINGERIGYHWSCYTKVETKRYFI